MHPMHLLDYTFFFLDNLARLELFSMANKVLVSWKTCKERNLYVKSEEKYCKTKENDFLTSVFNTH